MKKVEKEKRVILLSVCSLLFLLITIKTSAQNSVVTAPDGKTISSTRLTSEIEQIISKEKIPVFSNIIFSQGLKKDEIDQNLYDEILKVDSLLFNEAFNKCDLELFKKIMSQEFEFYDDRSGLNTSFEKEIASFRDRCSKPFILTRKLVGCSVHVLGDYGAVQIGTHDFYLDGVKVENAKFITVWKRTNDSWIVKRAISYDHKEASN